MNFITIPCHERLLPFIRNYWFLTSQCTARSVIQIFSNGAASIHFYLGQSVSLEGSERLYRTVLNHHSLDCMNIALVEGPFIVFGVEFVPFCSGLFFHTDFKEAHLTPEDLNDVEFEALSCKVHEADTSEARSKLLDDFFLKRLSEVPVDKMNLERMNDVFDEIVPTDGTMACPPEGKEEFSPSDLASAAHIGQKQFTRVFNQSVGMTPKSYLRLMRFHKALMELRESGDSRSLTEIAWHCGYYDLSHMTSDFKALCGYSPSELINAKDNLTEAFRPKFSNLMRKKIKIENLI